MSAVRADGAAEAFERLKAALASRYRIERELGRGGMATVYLAQDLKHDRPVAIKVLRPEVAASLGAERFLREIRIAARLEHPHILSLHDSGEAAGFLYYVMPYVEGETLAERLAREKQLGLDETLRIAAEVAGALSYAHGRGIVHRDIKPENILLSGGYAVIADFGIARALSAAGAERLTETGLAVGTPAYMSPEQAGGSGDVDARSDIYSLGCVVYELLTGTPPFTGPTAQVVMARHSLDPVPPVRTARPTAPIALERALQKALAKVPADRFATAAEFAAALTASKEAAAAAVPETPAPVTGAAAAPSFFSELKRRHVYHVGAAYAAFLLVVLQVVDAVFPALNFPHSVSTAVVALALLGFPVALVLAWAFEITREGIRRTQPVAVVPKPAEGLRPRKAPLLRGAVAVGAGIAVVAAAYAILPRVVSRAASAGAARIRSLAVLPFDNLSGDPEEEYFVAGMQDALIGELAQIGALRVISRRSAMRYKDSNRSVPEIARELNVDAVVEASVFRAGDSVRIQVQLIDALPEERQFWAQAYDRDVGNVLAIHGDVARDIARAIEVELTPQEETRLAGARRVDPEVYAAYLKGMFYLNKSTPEDLQRGLAYLEEAVEKNPADPLAYAGLALAYATLGHGPAPPSDAWPRARAAALRAVQLDSTLAEAHAALADVKLYYEHDWAGAGEAFRRANELNPSLAMNHYHHAWYLALLGRTDEAIVEHKRAQELDPLTPLHTVWLGGLYLYGGRYEEALEEARKSLERYPENAIVFFVLGMAYAQMGMYEEAIAAHEKMVAINPFWSYALGRTYAVAGRTEEARKILAELEAKETTSWGALGLATLYTALGEYDEALRWLAYKPPHAWLPWIRTDPSFEPLRDDPRFQELVRRMNLPER